MTKKRKEQAAFQELEFEDQADDEKGADEKGACEEGKGQWLNRGKTKRRKGMQVGDMNTRGKLVTTGKLDSIDREGKMIQCDGDDDDEHKSLTHVEFGLQKNRKKRKRKPRNNKYEGMSKIPTDGMSVERQNVKYVSEKSEQGSKLMPSKTGHGIMKVGSDQHDASTLGIDLKSGQGNHVNTGIKIKKKRKRKKKVKAKEEINNGDDDDDKRHKEAEEGTDGGKLKGGELKSKTGTTTAIDGDMEIIYASSNKKRKRRDQIWKNSRESWSHQLKSARFRFINETLYTCNGDESFRKFKGDRSLFEVYHEGYNQQIEHWPENPVDILIQYLNKRPQTCTVGDFGCGEAKIALSVKQKVHSFDIFPANERVTVCNISKVPLRSESLDVAIYCLSLMGINWIDYLVEANRVLRQGGILKIAEVASRFLAVDTFIGVLSKLGFQLKTKDLSNRMFFLFEFGKKTSCKEIPSSLGSILKPCKYKRR